MKIFGRTKTGFNKKSFSDALTEFFDELKEKWGEIDTEPDGAIGSLGRNAMLPHSRVWEQLEGLALSLNPNTSVGADFVRNAAYNGITRREASPTMVDAILQGTEGTVVPVGTKVKQANTTNEFTLREEVTISTDRVIRYSLEVPLVVTEGAVYSYETTHQTLGTLTIAYTAQSADSYTDVVNALVNAINIDSLKTDSGSVEVDENVITVNTRSPFRTIEISNVLNMELEFWCLSTFECTEDGPLVVYPETVNEIVTGVANLTAVTNHVAGQTGMLAETTEQMRSRRQYSFQLAGGGTIGAIRSKILEFVRRVTNCFVYENSTDSFDLWGRPPHSIHAVVENGDEQEICQMISDTMGGGINTFGQISRVITDSSGQPKNIYFDRPVIMFPHIQVTINEKNPEEAYPTDAVQRIQEAIWREGLRTQSTGRDLISQSLIGVVYRAVTGLLDISIEVAITGLPENDPSVPSGNLNDQGTALLTYSSGWQEKRAVVAPHHRVEWADAISKIYVIDTTI